MPYLREEAEIYEHGALFGLCLEYILLIIWLTRQRHRLGHSKSPLPHGNSPFSLIRRHFA